MTSHQSPVTHFDVVVIGGGTAGLVTASGCARLGRKVALIERAKLGGDCLWTGCVPTKALVASGKLAHQMRNARAFGLEPVEPRISPHAVMESMRDARHAIEHHDAPEKFRGLGIDVIEGEAKLVARDAVEVAGRTLTAKDIVIATGSRTAVPPIEGLAEAGYLDHATFLDRDDFPHSILILGGGYIGIEFAQILRRFGCEVTVVEALDEIVNKEDHEVIALVRNVLAGEGITIRTKNKVTGVRVANGKKLVRAGGDEIAVDEIFVASGRRGNTENLGLEALGVKMNRSYIAVDGYLQTSVPRIWAI
ncbi:MAG TPA: FAD-dependent oxidoreductase, partial [Thermoanaerobaculia bacterium]